MVQLRRVAILLVLVLGLSAPLTAAYSSYHAGRLISDDPEVTEENSVVEDILQAGRSQSRLIVERGAGTTTLVAPSVVPCFRTLARTTPSALDSFDVYPDIACGSNLAPALPRFDVIAGAKVLEPPCGVDGAVTNRCGIMDAIMSINGEWGGTVTFTKTNATTIDSKTVTIPASRYDVARFRIEIDTRSGDPFTMRIVVKDAANVLVTQEQLTATVVPRAGPFQLLDAVTRSTSRGWATVVTGNADAGWCMQSEDPSTAFPPGRLGVPGPAGDSNYWALKPLKYFLGPSCGGGAAIDVREYQKESSGDGITCNVCDSVDDPVTDPARLSSAE